MRSPSRERSSSRQPRSFRLEPVSLTTGRRKDICGVLGKWREVVKDGVASDRVSFTV